jgi:hypothetical protein
VQGTTAGSRGFFEDGSADSVVAVTNVSLAGGDGLVYISSNADLDSASAGGFGFLTGDLDDVNGALNLDVGPGRHGLMISDEATVIGDSATGTNVDGTDVVVTDNPNSIELPDIAANLGLDPFAEIFVTGLTGRPDLGFPDGGISYKADPDGDFYDGIRYWTGQGNDTVFVDGAHRRMGPTAERTATLLYTGFGDDTVTVDIDADDGFFSLNTQGAGSLLNGSVNAVAAAAAYNNSPSDNDFVDASASTMPQFLFGGLGNDHLIGGEAADVIFGDFGRVLFFAESGPDAVPIDVLGVGGRSDVVSSDSTSVAKLAFTPDTLLPDGTIDLSLRTMGGMDILEGREGEDLIIGGAFDDIIDGGTEDDLIFGDNVYLDRTGAFFQDFTNPRFRTLTGERIYGEDAGSNDGEVLIDRNNQYVNPDGSPVWADWEIKLLDHSAADEAGGLNDFGDDYIAGGAQNDMIFGQLGDDTIQGDGSIATALGLEIIPADSGEEHRLEADGVLVLMFNGSSPGIVDESSNTIESPDHGLVDGQEVIYYNGGGSDVVGIVDGESYIVRVVDEDTIRLAEPVSAARDDQGMLSVVASFESASDGDDYIEGNGGSDVIFGNLGQDDIIGGSSELFSLTTPDLRPDGTNVDDPAAGSLGNRNDIIFGGAGTEILRNEVGNEIDEGDDSHSRDADMILGDNGNIFRLVGSNGTGSGDY